MTDAALDSVQVERAYTHVYCAIEAGIELATVDHKQHGELARLVERELRAALDEMRSGVWPAVALAIRHDKQNGTRV